MALDQLTIIRKRIGDDRKTETESFPVDENTATIQLRYGNSSIFSLYDKERSNTALVLDVDYAFDSEAGAITLLYTPEPSTITAVYYFYAFTDDELNELMEMYGMNGACVEAIRWLIADSSRLHDYSRGATSESLSQVIKNLQDMLKDYNTLGSNEDGSPSGMTVMRRTNQFYRGRINVNTDLSRDDSLTL